MSDRGQCVTAMTGFVDLARNTQPVKNEIMWISQASESVLTIPLELYLQLVNKVVERSSRSAAVQEIPSGFRWVREMLLLLISAHLQGLSIPDWT